MNDLDLRLEVVSRSRQPLLYIWRWISLKPLEIEAWFQRTTNRKWYMGYRMVTWPIVTWPWPPKVLWGNTFGYPIPSDSLASCYDDDEVRIQAVYGRHHRVLHRVRCHHWQDGRKGAGHDRLLSVSKRDRHETRLDHHVVSCCIYLSSSSSSSSSSPTSSLSFLSSLALTSALL